MFTEQQQKALDFQRHLSVTANAGAGKTAVLVQRFIDILLHTPTRVNEIVAITFTEKAASELRKKIAFTVEEGIRNASSMEQRQVFEHIRDQLASATIGTIHSFCAQMLREYPVEADVDAAFTVLDGIDQRILQQEALKEAFEQIVNDIEGTEERNALLDLIRMFSRPAVQHYLSEMLNKREQIERLMSGLFSEHNSDADILKYWKDTLFQEVEKVLSEQGWLQSLMTIIHAADGATSSQTKNLVHQWNNELSTEKKIVLYQNIFELVFTQNNTLRKKFIGSGEEKMGLAKDIETVTRFHERTGELITDLASPDLMEANQKLLKVTRSFLLVYILCLERYEQRKLEYSLLDFEDLQLRVRTLLKKNEICKRIASKYHYIMVDEFQDTNRLQYEILHRLVSHFTMGNLFIVGDPKQSIYGFRNAEVEIFEQTKVDILASSTRQLPFFSNSIELTSTTNERQGAIVLSESFRLLSNLAVFVNTVFGNLMKSTATSFSVYYDELVKGRECEVRGAVELFLIPTKDLEYSSIQGNEEDAATKTECRMIAQRIVELNSSQYPIYENSEGRKSKNFEYKHAAILVRDRKYIREIEQALNEYHIPYALSGGIGFYQTQEMFDFLNYFKFLLRCDDDVALVGILRSPFFAISDAELYEISLTNKGEPFWDKLQRYVERRQSSQLVQRAYRMLSDDVIQAHRISIPFLIERILRQTGWQGTMSGLSSGRQHIANNKKLLRLAREFEGRGYAMLYDFVERLTMLVSEQHREGQATIDAQDNCVHVMTIHAAKGLEFPVVFLPFTHRGFRYDDPPYIDADFGIAFKAAHKDISGNELTSPLYNYLLRKSKQRTESEEIRIFYVACTRARDMLVLSGQQSEKLPAQSYLSKMLDSIGVDVNSNQINKKIIIPQTLKILERVQDHYWLKKIPHQLEIEVRNPETLHKKEYSLKDIASTSKIPKRLLIDSIPAQTTGEYFSATQIKTYLECPAKYFLKFVLGLPEQHSVLYNFDEEEESRDKLSSELEGIYTHTVLQDIYTQSISGDDLRNKIRDLVVSHRTALESTDEQLIEAVFKNVVDFKKSLFGVEVLSAREVHTEYSINTMFDKDYLTGTIDRLYKDSNGNWNIVDYKTDGVDCAHLVSRADVYKPQLLFYTYLVNKLFQQKIIRGTLVFLRHPSNPMHYIFDEKHFVEFESTIRSVISKIRANDFIRSLEMCETCTFRAGASCLISKQILGGKF